MHLNDRKGKDAHAARRNRMALVLDENAIRGMDAPPGRRKWGKQTEARLGRKVMYARSASVSRKLSNQWGSMRGKGLDAHPRRQ